MSLTVAVPGTLGEWVQGWIGDGCEALVSCVVGRKGKVYLEKGEDQGALPVKAGRALDLILREKGIVREGWSLRLDNPLPVAMGLASSTVDVCGVLAAVAFHARKPLDPEELFRLCCRIEPSDGVMFSGLALVDHLRGRLLEDLPAPPRLHLVTLLPSRTLKTEVYRRDPLFLAAVRRHETRHRSAYRIFRKGLFSGSLALIGAGATESARIQQQLIPREEFDLLEACCRECGGSGLVVAHSGTASAVMFECPEAVRRATLWFRSRWDGGTIERMVSRGGGLEVVHGARCPG